MKQNYPKRLWQQCRVRRSDAMARIRSVHPGLATDARFVVLSDAAQIFYVLLLTIADDAGVFRWEPLELRMQLRPASSTSVEPLLDELSAGNFLRRFEAGGNAYGAVRNFRRYQSPKLPTRRHPLPANLFPYVGLEPGALELVPRPKKSQPKEEELPQDWVSAGEALGKEQPKPRKQPKTNIELKQDDGDRLTQPLPSTTEALPQPLPTERERERDKDKEKERESLVDRTSSLPRETEPAAGTRPSPKILKKDQEGEAEPPQPPGDPPEGWFAEAEAARDEAGLEPVNLMLEWLKFAARADGKVELRRWIEWSLRAWATAEPRVRTAGGQPDIGLPEVPWPARMRHWHQSGWWHPDFGPKPNEPGCYVPTKYLA
jgi:hypothetical protein